LGLLAVVGLTGRGLASQSLGESPTVPSEARSSKPGPKAKLTPDEARELMQALRHVQTAVAAEHETKGAKADVKVNRPARTVTAPALTPPERDRLVAQYLTKNDPKVDPAPITTDVEFVRRAYFDLIGKPPTPEQFMAFVRDRSHDKRGRLIDRLLN